jgi:hypothetical protein
LRREAAGAAAGDVDLGRVERDEAAGGKIEEERRTRETNHQRRKWRRGGRSSELGLQG